MGWTKVTQTSGTWDTSPERILKEGKFDELSNGFDVSVFYPSYLELTNDWTKISIPTSTWGS